MAEYNRQGKIELINSQLRLQNQLSITFFDFYPYVSPLPKDVVNVIVDVLTPGPSVEGTVTLISISAVPAQLTMFMCAIPYRVIWN